MLCYVMTWFVNCIVQQHVLRYDMFAPTWPSSNACVKPLSSNGGSAIFFWRGGLRTCSPADAGFAYLRLEWHDVLSRDWGFPSPTHHVAFVLSLHLGTGLIRRE